MEKPNERNQVRELKKQIKQLKEVLGQTQAEKVIGDEFLAIACENLGLDVEEFKKKQVRRCSQNQRKKANSSQMSV